VLSALRVRFNRTGADNEPAQAAARILAAAEHYERPEVRAGFFQVPPSPAPTVLGRAPLDAGERLDLTWPSPFVPHYPAARESYLRWEANRAAHVRALLHAVPARTSIVCLHGYAGGSRFVEEVAFQARWLYALGTDVVLFALPFHGARAQRGAPSWPSPDPVRTVEGFGHAIHDLRSLIAWLRARPGAERQRVAVVGMSLGAYTASLFATTDELDFLSPIIPAASWPELLWAHGAGETRGRAEAAGVTLPLLRRAMSIIAPLERAPLLGPDRVLVLSARGDRITPPEHAEWLARHFRGVHLTLPGGHVLQLGRREAFTAIAQRLALLGLIDRR
jgi:pimeloyl-ACP methyl ester carboxylesterase